MRSGWRRSWRKGRASSTAAAKRHAGFGLRSNDRYHKASRGPTGACVRHGLKVRCQGHVDQDHYQQGNGEYQKVGPSWRAGSKGVKIVGGFLGSQKTDNEDQSRSDYHAQRSLPLTECTPFRAAKKRIDQATVTVTVAVSQLPPEVQIR